MNENMKYIEIVFENCESIVIPIERVIYFKNGKLAPLVGSFYEPNTYRTDYINLQITYQDELELEYDRLKYDDPLGVFVNNPTSNHVKDRPDILGRVVNHNDIVTIDILTENEERIKTIYVPWHEKDEYENRLMSLKKHESIIEIEIKKEDGDEK